MTEYTAGFETFWNCWPNNGKQPFANYTRKKNKPGAFKKWQQKKLESKVTAICAFVEKCKKYNKAWLKDSGGWIPLPATFLGSEDWNEDIADIRDERKDRQKAEKPVHAPDTLPNLSRYARYANRYLLDKLRRTGGTGSRDGQPSETLARAIKAKNEVVRQAESDGDWEDDDFVSVIRQTIDGAFSARREAA